VSLTFSGENLRDTRAKAELSQARLAELTQVPQHLISSFELGKSSLNSSQLEQILNVVSNLEVHEKSINRKKRYRKHSYGNSKNKEDRSHLSVRSDGNAAYLRELESLSSRSKTKFTGLSLFAGCGGFSLGFRSAGCDIKGFVELDDALANIYSTNFPKVPRIGSDICNVTNEDIDRFASEVGDIDVIIGGPPCQGFSLAGKRNIDDPRNYLFQEYMRFIDVIRPKIAVVENVRLLTSMKSNVGGFVKDQIASDFADRGYHTKLFEVNAAAYGVPQNRFRAVFVAVRNDLPNMPSFPMPRFNDAGDLINPSNPHRTFADACSDLPFIESGEVSEGAYHKAVKHPDHVIEWLWDVPQGKSAHENDDPEMRPPSGYNTTYKRQVWTEPASTVQTTFGMISGCRNVHPIATRSLTIREAARIQSFPDDYQFVGSLGAIRTGIGNAVPPLLARAIAKHILPIL